MYDNQVSVTRIERLRVVKKEEKLEGLLLVFSFIKDKEKLKEILFEQTPPVLLFLGTAY